MSDSNAPNLPGTSDKQLDRRATNRSKSLNLQFSNGSSPPKLTAPPDFIFGWKDVKQAIGKELVPLTEIDKIITEYLAECLEIYFTVKLIESVNEDSAASNASKLEYAGRLYIKIYNLPAKTDDTEIRKILSFYFKDSPTVNSLFNLDILPEIPGLPVFNTQFNLSELKSLLKPLEENYVGKAAQTSFLHKAKSIKVSSELVKDAFGKANK